MAEDNDRSASGQDKPLGQPWDALVSFAVLALPALLAVITYRMIRRPIEDPSDSGAET